MNIFYRLFDSLNGRGYLRFVPDKLCLEILFRINMNQKLHLNPPVTFNEKIQWLKLYNREERFTAMVDKIEAKKYVSKLIGEEYIIPTIGTWNSFDEINFNKFPDSFVLKCNHNSGNVIICKDRSHFNYNQAKAIVNKALKMRYYWAGREWPYKNVIPKIIAESYLEDENDSLNDYKFFCFNGKVKCFKIDFDRYIDHKANYYDRNMSLLPFGETICPPDYKRKLELPVNIEKMINIAETLSKNIPFLRVDLYEVKGHIYFGELTFSPASGFGRFTNEDWDTQMGNWIDLGDIEKK